MTIERAQEIVGKATGIPMEFLTEVSSMERTPMWDSLMTLKIVLEVEERYGHIPKEVDFQKFTSIVSLSEVIEALEVTQRATKI